MVGVEFDMVVEDSLAALKLYQEVFGVECVEATALQKGENEVVFTLYGARFHMLDQNQQFHLKAPAKGAALPFWFNVMVEDIEAVYAKAVGCGFMELQPLTQMMEYGVSTGSLLDPYGYQWMITQLHKVKSLDERLEAYEKAKEANT